MRSPKEVIRKRKKLRRRLHNALYIQSKQKKKENCKFWTQAMPEPCKCVYPSLNNQPPRECPNAVECPDFKNRWGASDVEERYLRLVNDNNYLAKNYRDLFILNWMLEDDADEEEAKRELGFFLKLKLKLKELFS